MKTAAPQAQFLQICKEKDGKMAPQAKILQYALLNGCPSLILLILVGTHLYLTTLLFTKIMIFRTKYKNLGQFMTIFEFLGHFMIFMTNGRPARSVGNM